MEGENKSEMKADQPRQPRKRSMAQHNNSC
jgi:hypothetical protein